jgi:hypothetical protein
MYTNINMDDWIRINFANIFTKKAPHKGAFIKL